jgi:tetratricopeptide (TPR) repeat protein
LEVLDVRDDAWWRALIEIRLGQAEASSMTDASLPFDLRADLEETVMSRGSAPQQSKYYCQLAVQLASEERWLPTEEVIDTARRALDTAEHDGGDYLRAYATGLLGSLLAMKGSHAEAETVLRQARGLSRRCTDTLGEAASILFLGISARLSGDVRMTEVHAVELRTMAADRIQMPEFVSGAEAQLAWVALRRGRLDEAAALAEGALEIWQRDPACSQSVWMMAWPALSCALAEGDLCRAAEFAVLMTRPDQQALADDIDRRLADAAAIVRRRDKKKGAKLFAQLEAEAGEYGYA